MTLAAKPILETTAFGLASGAVIGLMALGLVLIYRTTGIMNFAHWAIGIISIVIYSLLTGAGLLPALAIPICIAVAILAGVGAYRAVFKRVSRGNQIVVILIAIGLAQLYTSLIGLVGGFGTFTRLPPWLPVTDVKVGNAVLRSTEILIMILAVGIAFGFLIWFRVSRTGRALRAVAQNREAATLAGIDEIRYSSIAWGIGAAMAAVALLLFMPHTAGERGGLITGFDFTPLGTLLIPAFGAALVGGLVNLPMAVAGGFLIGLTRDLMILAPKPWSDMRAVIAAFVIVVLLLLRTERFFATKQELEALET